MREENAQGLSPAPGSVVATQSALDFESILMEMPIKLRVKMVWWINALVLRILAWFNSDAQAQRIQFQADRAYNRGELDSAKQLALQLLNLAEVGNRKCMYSNSVHHAYRVLGLVALARGDIPEARECLLRSAEVQGSPQLSSFGPSMELAKALLEVGEWGAAKVYLECCSRFWRDGRERIEKWIEQVEKQELPNFGANLVCGKDIRDILKKGVYS